MDHEHLTRQEIEQWRDHGVGDRERIVSRIARCSTCRALAAEIERAAPPETGPARFDPAAFIGRGHEAGPAAPARRPVWTDWGHQRWTLAAAAVLILALSPLVRDRFMAPESDRLRGGSLVALTPAGEVDGVQEFRWHSDVPADSFVVEVLDSNDVVMHSAASRTTVLVPGPELRSALRPGQYRWRVTSRDSSGGTVLVSPPQTFTIRR